MSGPTVTQLLVPLAHVDDRGIHYEDTFVSWHDHIQAGADLGAALTARLDPAKPPHIGCCWATLRSSPASWWPPR
jgi:fatty-acyl-CoA synthase